MSKATEKYAASSSQNEEINHLINKIQAGNAPAFRTLFKIYYAPLVRHAYRFVQDIQIAEDIVSDIFLKIWEKRSELNIKKSATAYLYSMVRNHALNYLKRNRIELTDFSTLDLIIPESDSIEEIVQRNELKTHLEKAIIELPERTREVFIMHRYDHLKYSEIAEILNIKEGTVETHMVRALRYLRKRLAFLLSISLFFK